MTKKMITKYSEEYISAYDMDGKLSEVANKVAGWIEKYGPDARLDYDDGSLSICFEREETDEEYAYRVEQERKYAVLQEKQERQALAKLMAKYGNTQA